jgi:NTP pyrophosphatase (non-canonical NTP hydrolase)
MQFSAMKDRALAVRSRYHEHEQRTYGRAWSTTDLALGLVGDVGDLAKLIQAHEGVRDVENASVALEHELADVLWSLIVLADRCDVDLEASFVRTMKSLEDALDHSATQTSDPRR